jgi:C-terminal processing protease CtpA/Prc
VLTSKDTISGSEELAYDLQNLGRAKSIGETTAGAAHPARDYELNDNFVVFVPNKRPINLITKTNWEGVGVVPDISVSSDAAFQEASELARKELAAGGCVESSGMRLMTRLLALSSLMVVFN